MNLKRIYELALHLMWPVSCPVCSRPAVVICDECLDSLFRTQKVITRNVEFLNIYSASLYSNKDMKQAIIFMKYEGYRSLGQILGFATAKIFDRPDIDLLVPVPLHIGSTRNFNQASEIAKGLGHAWNIKALDAARWTQSVPRRVFMSAAERISLADDVFAVLKRLDGLRVALVDDVCTTGTTLLRLAQACTCAGAKVFGAYALASTS